MVSVRLPAYLNPPEGPYYHPPLLNVGVVIDIIVLCGALLILMGVVFVLDRREWSKHRK